MSSEQLCKMRGKDISMIFQNPMSAFNPVLPDGRQIAEPLEFHEHLSEKERMHRVAGLLKEVGISNPNTVPGSTRTSFPAACCSAQ